MFWLALSVKLGMSVSTCQQAMTSAEYAEWIAFNNITGLILDSQYLQQQKKQQSIKSAFLAAFGNGNN